MNLHKPGADWYLPVHFSNLKHMAKAAALYEYHAKTTEEDTRDYRIGRAFHSMVLGGTKVVCFDGRRDPRSKEWQAFQTENSGAEILIASEYEVALGMAESVLNHPQARAILDRCPVRELPITGKLLDLPCEGRIDLCGPGIVAELKSDAIAQPDRWQKRAQYLGYSAQLDWYRTLLVADAPHLPITWAPDETDECYSIVCEKTPPYLPVVHHAKPRLLEDGRRSWRLWLEQLKTCIESGVWPGYAESIVEWDSLELEQGEAIEFEEAVA